MDLPTFEELSKAIARIPPVATRQPELPHHPNTPLPMDMPTRSPQPATRTPRNAASMHYQSFSPLRVEQSRHYKPPQPQPPFQQPPQPQSQFQQPPPPLFHQYHQQIQPGNLAIHPPAQSFPMTNVMQMFQSSQPPAIQQPSTSQQSAEFTTSTAPTTSSALNQLPNPLVVAQQPSKSAGTENLLDLLTRDIRQSGPPVVEEVQDMVALAQRTSLTRSPQKISKASRTRLMSTMKYLKRIVHAYNHIFDHVLNPEDRAELERTEGLTSKQQQISGSPVPVLSSSSMVAQRNALVSTGRQLKSDSITQSPSSTMGHSGEEGQLMHLSAESSLPNGLISADTFHRLSMYAQDSFLMTLIDDISEQVTITQPKNVTTTSPLLQQQQQQQPEAQLQVKWYPSVETIKSLYSIDMNRLHRVALAKRANTTVTMQKLFVQ